MREKCIHASTDRCVYNVQCTCTLCIHHPFMASIMPLHLHRLFRLRTSCVCTATKASNISIYAAAGNRSYSQSTHIHKRWLRCISLNCIACIAADDKRAKHRRVNEHISTAHRMKNELCWTHTQFLNKYFFLSSIMPWNVEYSFANFGELITSLHSSPSAEIPSLPFVHIKSPYRRHF